MVSIEKNTQAEECFRFNQPYRTIDLKFGQSKEVLPRLSWDKRTILWLDYDGKLDTDALADVDTFCLRAVSGSLLAVSVNAHIEPEPPPDVRTRISQETGEAFDLEHYRFRRLRDLIGAKTPPGTRGADLRGHGLVHVFRATIINEIEEVLTTRNALSAPGDRLSFKQVFFFDYKDGAQMVTVGGVLVKQDELALFDACAFASVEYSRQGTEAYEIKVPCLTGKEIRHLNAQLPSSQNAPLQAPGVSDDDIRAYAEMYRYFPEFTEILTG
jgi:hypothetical protein